MVAILVAHPHTGMLIPRCLPVNREEVVRLNKVAVSPLPCLILGLPMEIRFGARSPQPLQPRSEAVSRPAKARSRACDLAPVIEELWASGAVSLRQIAVDLNARSIRTAMGREWSAMQMQRVMERV